MPKPKPDRVIRHEIALSRPLQESIDSLVMVQGVGKAGELAQGLGIPELTKDLSEPEKVIGTLYGIATVLEAMGFETGLPTPIDLVGWWQERDAKMAGVKAERELSGAPDNVVKQIVDLFRGLLGMDYKPFDYNPFNDAAQAAQENNDSIPADVPTPPGGWNQWAQDVSEL
jgi:hypothetical protein